MVDLAVFICRRQSILQVLFLSEPLCYYRGLYQVKVVTKSEGYWIVEALENFEDFIDGEKVIVKAGETRIVTPADIQDNKNLPPCVREHGYELKMEKKVKKMVEEYDAKADH